MQASEKLWGAVAHALTAVAMERGWRYGSHRDFIIAAQQLAEESGVGDIAESLDEARQFHANFYRNFLGDEELALSRPRVQGFVIKVLDCLD